MSSLRSILKACLFGFRTPNLDWHMVEWWLAWEDWSTRRKTYSSATLSTTNLIWSHPVFLFVFSIILVMSLTSESVLCLRLLSGWLRAWSKWLTPVSGRTGSFYACGHIITTKAIRIRQFSTKHDNITYLRFPFLLWYWVERNVFAFFKWKVNHVFFKYIYNI
jgi:hypothetical protein